MKKTGLEKKLNIVSLDIPYPPDYGGAVDIFQRLSSLKKMEVKINLLCTSIMLCHNTISSIFDFSSISQRKKIIE